MTTEAYLSVGLYTLGGFLLLWQVVRVWRNIQSRRGLGDVVVALQDWAHEMNWSLVDTRAKAPWRKPFEEQSGTAYLIPKAVALGLIGGVSGMVAVGEAYDDFDGEGNPGITSGVVYWRFTIRPVGGWVRVRSAASRFTGQIKQTEMESVDFNSDVTVHAYPAKFAYELLPPDMMEWYLHTSSRPWIHVHDNVLLIVFEGIRSHVEVEKQYREVEHIIKAVQKTSGLSA